MSRTDYDDMNGRRYSRNGGDFSRLLFVVILMAVLVCALAVLVWVGVLKNQSPEDPYSGSSVSAYMSGLSASETSSDASQTSELKEAASEESPEEEISVSLAISDALSGVSSSIPGSDFVSASDYNNTYEENARVEDVSVELKTGVIAQNLTINQASNATRNMVHYTEAVLKEGESLSSVAENYGLNIQTLISVNRITNPSALRAGDVLQIPDRDGTVYNVREGDSVSSVAKQFGLSDWSILVKANGLRGDSLDPGSEIFIPFEGTTVAGTVTAVQEKTVSFSAPCAVQISGFYGQKTADPVTDTAMILDGILFQSDLAFEVLCAEAGTVVDLGTNTNGSKFVKLVHENGYTTYYNYLESTSVQISQQIEKGQILGSSSATGPDLYSAFFRIEQSGIPLDPSLFF